MIQKRDDVGAQTTLQGDELMLLDRRVVSAFLVAAAAAASGCTMPPKPLMLKCAMEGEQVDVISLDLATGRATLLSVAPPLAGTAQATQTEYDVLFQPGPEGSPRLHIRINRYSFRATREPGRHGAGAADTTGSHSTGGCERYKGRPL
jgi:hypothetical protein